MIRATILAVCLALPAFAGDSMSWGSGPWSTARAQLVQGQAHVAEVTVNNRLVGGPSDLHFVLDAGPMQIGVTVLQEPGDVPDLFVVEPPEGFVAVPARVSVNEGASAVIRIYDATGALLG